MSAVAFNPIFYGYGWIADTLRADSTLDSQATGGVWRTDVPRNSDNNEILRYPSIVIINQDAPARMVIGDDIVWYQCDYLVKAINVQRDQATTVSIINRVNVLLHQASGSVTGASILRSWQTGGVHESEPQQGDRFDHLGNYFSLIIKQA